MRLIAPHIQSMSPAEVAERLREKGCVVLARALTTECVERHRRFQRCLPHSHYGNDVISLKMPAGSGLVYNTTVVHRAHPIRRSGWERKSLFFQAEKKGLGGEPLLIDTRFARDLTSEQQYFLGFGADPEYRTFPQTSLATIRPSTLAAQIGALSVALAKSLARAPMWSLGPDQRARLKQWIKLPGRH